MRHSNKINNDENEEKLSDSVNKMYKTEILNKDFSSIEEYMRNWSMFQNKFISEHDSFKRFEVWCNFSMDKLIDG